MFLRDRKIITPYKKTIAKVSIIKKVFLSIHKRLFKTHTIFFIDVLYNIIKEIRLIIKKII